MRLERLLAVVRRWWWLVLASVLLCTGASFFVPARMPALYEATVQISVNWYGGSLNAPSSSSLNDPNYDPPQAARRVQNIVKERATLEAAAESVGLPYVPSPENVSTRLVPESTVLEISVRDTDPERARALADAIVHQLILQTPNEIAEDQARQAFVRSQLTQLEADIQATKEEIQAEQAKLAEANSARAIQQIQDNVAALQQKLASYQSIYASLESSVERRLKPITIEQPATTPTRPISSPPAAETVLLAAALGLLLGLVGAFTMEFLVDLRTRRRASMAGGRGS